MILALKDAASHTTYIMGQGAYAPAYSICRLTERKEHAYAI